MNQKLHQSHFKPQNPLKYLKKCFHTLKTKNNVRVKCTLDIWSKASFDTYVAMIIFVSIFTFIIKNNITFNFVYSNLLHIKILM